MASSLLWPYLKWQIFSAPGMGGIWLPLDKVGQLKIVVKVNQNKKNKLLDALFRKYSACTINKLHGRHFSTFFRQFIFCHCWNKIAHRFFFGKQVICYELSPTFSKYSILVFDDLKVFNKIMTCTCAHNFLIN